MTNEQNQITEQDQFDYGFRLLEKRYPKEVLDEEIKTLYLAHWMQSLTADEFLEAVNYIILHSRFMPTAGDVVTHIHGSKEARAIIEWRMILDASGQPDGQEKLTYLSLQAKVALKAIGGLGAVAMASGIAERGQLSDQQRLEKKFTTVYCSDLPKDILLLSQASVETPTSVNKPPVEYSPMPNSVKEQIEALKKAKSMNRDLRNSPTSSTSTHVTQIEPQVPSK